MIDSHCHLDSPQFKKDRARVLERARQAGVTLVVVPGVDIAASCAALELAHKHADIVAAVGVHPHDAKTLDAPAAGQLRTLARQPRVVAIGEIGLDYYRDLSPRDVQRRAFQTQLELASELGLPVIVHDREAHQDVLAILSEWRSALARPGSQHPALAERPGVLHSFSGDVALAEHVLELGFYLGISGPVTYPNAEKTHAVVRAAPLDRLLLETDAPYLAPQACRGKRNEPACVRQVAEAIARLKAVALEQVIDQTTQNARALLGTRLE